MRVGPGAVLVLAALLSAPSTADTPPPINPPIAQNDRLLGYTFVGGNEALDFFDIAAIGKQIGFDITELSLNWGDFEGEGHGTEHGPWNDAHLIAVNTYYKAQGLKIIVVFSPINRERNYLPSDLQGLPWDHPDVVARFKTWIDHVLDIVRTPASLQWVSATRSRVS